MPRVRVVLVAVHALEEQRAAVEQELAARDDDLAEAVSVADLKAGNLAGAIQNIQMALTFEADNAGSKAMLEELRERQKAIG